MSINSNGVECVVSEVSKKQRAGALNEIGFLSAVLYLSEGGGHPIQIVSHPY